MKTSALTEDQKSIESRLQRDMDELLPRSSWTLTEKLAVSCRILAGQAHGQSLAGQITLRGDEPDTFWTTNFGFGLADTTADNAVLVDQNLALLQGQGMPNPGIRFHMWIYRARADVQCIVHTHAPYTAALSMLGQELIVAHMDSCMFYEDCAFLSEWPGVPLANEEGAIIADALGDKHSVLLAHHGLLTTGKSLEEATYLAVSFEQAARLQLVACAAGTIQPVDRRHALKARKFLLGKALVESTFNYWGRRIVAESPEILSSTNPVRAKP